MSGDSPQLALVLSMGFDREMAVQALARSRNDVEIAVELLSSGDGKPTSLNDCGFCYTVMFPSVRTLQHHC